jgi:hypothetical protein
MYFNLLLSDMMVVIIKSYHVTSRTAELFSYFNAYAVNICSISFRLSAPYFPA